MLFFFFFQAEDGIRDLIVTGVQTCALPIYGGPEWRPSPGGLVTALEPVMREAGGAWIGWSGDAGPAPGAFEADGLHLVGLGLSENEVRLFYEGFCNATLWPLYHDVITPPW